MGVATHKIDFLYPQHSHPTRSQFHFSNQDLNKQPQPLKKQQNHQQKSVFAAQNPNQQKPIQYALYKDIYDDYTESNVSKNQEQRKNQLVQGQVQKKILFLPSLFQGPLLLYFQKYYMNNENIDIQSLKSLSKSSSKVYSRKSSIVSLQSLQSRNRKIQSSNFSAESDLKKISYLQKSKEAEQKGKYDKGIKYLEKGLQLCTIEAIQKHKAQEKQGMKTEQNMTTEQTQGDIKNWLEKALFHKQLGRLNKKALRLQKSKEHFLSSLKLYKQYSSENIAILIKIHEDLAEIYEENNDLKMALEHYNNAIQLQRLISVQQNDPLAANLLAKIAFVEWKMGNFKRAVETYGQALYINKMVLGYNHINVAQNYYNLSLCLFEIKEYSLWLDYHCQSLKIMKKLKLAGTQQYKLQLLKFKVNLRILMSIQNFNKDLVLKSIGLMNLILDTDDLIFFLSEIKQDIQKFYQ